jgi:uncharacterized glyoxalase superfamily protein PhnB
MLFGRKTPPSPVNRSMPTSVVTPVLHYPDVREAVQWLCGAFGFRERLRIANHRSQLDVGNASVVIAQGAQVYPACGWPGHSTMVRIADVDAHHEHSHYSGAHVISRPVTFPYGERQYTVLDIGGHSWTFSQTKVDVDPTSWGGIEVGKDAQARSARIEKICATHERRFGIKNVEPFA